MIFSSAPNKWQDSPRGFVFLASILLLIACEKENPAHSLRDDGASTLSLRGEGMENSKEVFPLPMKPEVQLGMTMGDFLSLKPCKVASGRTQNKTLSTGEELNILTCMMSTFDPDGLGSVTKARFSLGLYHFVNKRLLLIESMADSAAGSIYVYTNNAPSAVGLFGKMLDVYRDFYKDKEIAEGFSQEQGAMYDAGVLDELSVAWKLSSNVAVRLKILNSKTDGHSVWVEHSFVKSDR